jgi:pyruvate,water dikinase
MTQAGIAVPPGFAVTTDAYSRMIEHHGLGPEIARRLDDINPDDLDTLERSARDIRELICSLPLPSEIEDDLRSAYTRMGSELPVAVRSSATAEDLPDASFAGQQDTYLWIIGADAVVEKVRACWASLFTSRAIAYRTKNRIGHTDVQMSVGVQKMVNARTAGVAMTLDPANGDRTRIVIDASWGLGETVVSGLVTPDNFKVEKVLMQVLERKIADKHIEIVGSAASGAALEREIEGERRAKPSLSDAEVIAVAELAKRLERFNKTPQDVEWAIDADLPPGANLLALQSRPETIWSNRKKEPRAPVTYTTGMASLVSALGVTMPGQ